MQEKVALAPDLVRTFVAASHGDLDQMKTLLEQEPMLINACWDWGNGDWETGLEAAAHMGRRDIALYLISQGARLNLFAAAMLGELALVQAILKAFPAMLHQRGAHGIPLLVHAQKGGEQAEAVVAFLQILLAQA